MILPPPLLKGDTIGIVSTARKISPEELRPAINTIAQWGFKVKMAANLHSQHHQFAGTDEQRISDIQTFINDPSIKAILCARGGYGTVRIIDAIDFSAIKKHPKWIAGYSDVTVLHNKLSNIGIASLHSTMPINFATNATEALASLNRALTGQKLCYDIKPHPFNKSGIGEGLVTGGNLSMLYSQTGSPTAIRTNGRILFMEDLDEYLYHIDRMMYNLKRNRYLDAPAGVVIGSMGNMNDNAIPFGSSAEEIIHQHLAGYNYPVCFGFPAGHLPDNRTLIMGQKARLIVQADRVTLHY